MVGMFSYFMQDVILEPFGGEVFGLSAASTTRYNAYMGIGLIAGMLPGGLLLIPRIGKSAVAQIGCTILVLAFGLLAASGFAASAAVLPLLITLLGLGAGFFTVGSVALMMDMTLKEHTGLFVGVWTLAQAVAKGPASLVAGALQGAFVALGAPVGQAYGTVFAIEALGMLWALLLLRRVEPKVLPQEFAPRSQPAAHGLDQASQNRA
jgi:BCD family chlorophyll transporter-like MFS transporter